MWIRERADLWGHGDAGASESAFRGSGMHGKPCLENHQGPKVDRTGATAVGARGDLYVAARGLPNGILQGADGAGRGTLGCPT